MLELPIASVGWIIKNVGVERISNEVKTELTHVLEKIGIEISKDAIKVAKHTGKKTVTADDVKFVSKIKYWLSQ